jgi:hypothetical protein
MDGLVVTWRQFARKTPKVPPGIIAGNADVHLGISSIAAAGYLRFDGHLNIARITARINAATNRPMMSGSFHHRSLWNGAAQCMHIGSAVGVARRHFMQMRRGALGSRPQETQRGD